MAKFETAFLKTAAHEGGYANDPRDRGGETYKGIARKFWPGWKGWAEVDAAGDLKPNAVIKSKKLDALVAEFYMDQFWRPAGCDRLEVQAIADEIFDTAVNMGVKVSVRLLQDALVLMGEKIEIDGRIGPKTLEAANGANPEILLRLLNILQGARYLDIVRRDPTQRKFLLGWLRRTDADETLGKAE